MGARVRRVGGDARSWDKLGLGWRGAREGCGEE